MDNKATGIGILDVLLIVNIVLKLVGSINWSWWIVLWPLWTQIALVIIFIFLVFIIME